MELGLRYDAEEGERVKISYVGQINIPKIGAGNRVGTLHVRTVPEQPLQECHPAACRSASGWVLNTHVTSGQKIDVAANASAPAGVHGKHKSSEYAEEARRLLLFPAPEEAIMPLVDTAEEQCPVFFLGRRVLSALSMVEWSCVYHRTAPQDKQAVVVVFHSTLSCTT